MSSKSRLRIALLPLPIGLALIGCSDYADRPLDTATPGAPSGAAGTGNAAGTGGAATSGTPTGGTPTAGTSATEGNPMTAGLAGASNTGVSAGGSANTATNDAGITAGAGGSGPVVTTRGDGPCDVYAAGNTPCVAAYSTIRALSSTYDGPLYQVRRGAPNAFQNTGTGGQTQDIGMLPNGFADAAAQQAFCLGQSCTFSVLYDQSGRGNDITVAKRGSYGCDRNPPDTACTDDVESNAAAAALTVGGNDVYSLFMEPRQGYRQIIAGNGMPLGRAPQGIYMLADGTHAGGACCWDFGNVTTDPTEYHTMNTLFFGDGFWGSGTGSPPWFMADFEGGVWAGGAGESTAPNQANPSLAVPFALGFLKTDNNNGNGNYALRMANVATATNLVTAYEGPLPKPMDNQGAVVLGVGGDNSNSSFGTFYEGAIVAGYPAADVELNVMRNIQAAGYGQ
jgi:hypothetical protein